MKIISVVRDFEMYDRLVRNNPFNKGADFSCFDNRQENLGIPARYNQFLNGYDFADEDWLVFCHEDWEVRESWQPLLERLDKTVFTEWPAFVPFVSDGRCMNSLPGVFANRRKTVRNRLSGANRFFRRRKLTLLTASA